MEEMEQSIEGGLTWLHPDFHQGTLFSLHYLSVSCTPTSAKKTNFVFHLKTMQEAAVVPPYVAFAVRPNPGFWEFVKVNAEDLSVDGITTSEYLKFKEMIFDENW
jgi:hypothetical protein